MARDGVFFHQLAKIHPRFPDAGFSQSSPVQPGHRARRYRDFEQLLTYVVFTGWLFMHWPRPAYSFIAKTT